MIPALACLALIILAFAALAVAGNLLKLVWNLGGLVVSLITMVGR